MRRGTFEGLIIIQRVRPPRAQQTKVLRKFWRLEPEKGAVRSVDGSLSLSDWREAGHAILLLSRPCIINDMAAINAWHLVFVITFYSRRDWRRVLLWNESGVGCCWAGAHGERKKRTRIKKGKLRLGFALAERRPLRATLHSFSHQTNSRPRVSEKRNKIQQMRFAAGRTFLGRVSTGLLHANLIFCAQTTTATSVNFKPSARPACGNFIIYNECQVRFIFCPASSLLKLRVPVFFLYLFTCVDLFS